MESTGGPECGVSSLTNNVRTTDKSTLEKGSIGRKGHMGKTKLCKHGYLIGPLQRGILHLFTKQATIHCIPEAQSMLKKRKTRSSIYHRKHHGVYTDQVSSKLILSNLKYFANCALSKLYTCKD